MSGVSKCVSGGRKRDGVYPAARAVAELATHSVERQALSPHGRLGALVNALDESGKHARMGVGRAGGEKDRVGVPVQREDGSAERLLEVLRHPPVILLFEVTHGDDSGSRTDGEFRLIGRPANMGCRAVDAEENESGFPACGRRLPDKGITILRAGDNLPALGSDVNAGHGLVVSSELILQSKAISRASVKLDAGVPRNGKQVAISAERVVRDGLVEKQVDFGDGHDDWFCGRSSTLLSRVTKGMNGLGGDRC